MISERKTAKACLDVLLPWTDSKGFYLVIDGETYEPKPTETYVMEKLLTNDDNSVGMSATSSDYQRPIYQVTIKAPKAQAKWLLLDMVLDVKALFRKADFLLNDGQQKVQVQTVSSSPYLVMETHGAIVISVNLAVIATNI